MNEFGNTKAGLRHALTAANRKLVEERAAREVAEKALCHIVANARAAMQKRILRMESAGEAVAAALIVACRELGEKNPRKTIPVLVAWEDAKKVERENEKCRAT